MLAPDSRGLFSFDDDACYLDHGAYGATPREVLARRMQAQARIEASPRAFFDFECRPAWTATCASVAQRFGARADDLALIENATDGVNAVLRSLRFQPGDEILITSMSYLAAAMAAKHVARESGARVVEARLPYPAPSRQACVAAIEAALTPRTRLAILDHITSATALVLPIAEMAAVCRARGVAVLADGAHAPGQIPLDVSEISVDWYVANLHKWHFAPRACGFLWARAERRENLAPAVLSWAIGEAFPGNFWWTGTRDGSSWLSIPEAFAFADRLGVAAIQRHNRAMVREASALLAEAWGVETSTPDEMIAAMALVPLPEGAAFQISHDGRARIQSRLWRDHRIACPCVLFEGRLYLRISAQIYNDRSDYERLARAIEAMRGEDGPD